MSEPVNTRAQNGVKHTHEIERERERERAREWGREGGKKGGLLCISSIRGNKSID